MVDQNGTRYTADDYPVPTGIPVTATGTGTLRYVADGGSGPAHPAAGNKDPLAGVAAGITPAQATNAVNVAVDFAAPGVLVGAPQLKLAYTGTTPPGVRPTPRLRAARRRRDRNRARQPDHADRGDARRQAPPDLGAARGHRVHRARRRAHHLPVVATTTAYAEPRLGGSITFGTIAVSLPVAAGLHAG